MQIVDYKTNKLDISPKKRAWQLGFYALGVKNTFNLNPKKLTLEMLRMEKPYQGEVDADGNVMSGRSKGFNINEVKEELVECAKKIVTDYEGEFLPVKDDTPCTYCGYRFYCPKWGEK